MISVVATCYLLGVSARGMDMLVARLGVNRMSKSQVSRMPADLVAQVAAFRARSLDEASPFTFVAADALTLEVCENGRMINAVVLVATGVNHRGYRKVLGVQVATSQAREPWNVLFADPWPCLAGVLLVTNDAHAGLVEAIAANLSGTAWQRCRPGPPGVHLLHDLVVIRLIVSLLTLAPYTSARCAEISPVVRPLANGLITSVFTESERGCRGPAHCELPSFGRSAAIPQEGGGYASATQPLH